MDIHKAREIASQAIVHPTEASTAGLVVLLAILDRLDAQAPGRVAPAPTSDEKPPRGKAAR